MENAKLYVVTRRTLPPGPQAVQSAHAALDFSVRHPEITRAWNEQSNYLIMLSVENEDELTQLVRQAEAWRIPNVPFYEPDLGNSLTAVALAPGDLTQSLCASFPLALREVRT